MKNSHTYIYTFKCKLCCELKLKLKLKLRDAMMSSFRVCEPWTVEKSHINSQDAQAIKQLHKTKMRYHRGLAFCVNKLTAALPPNSSSYNCEHEI